MKQRMQICHPCCFTCLIFCEDWDNCVDPVDPLDPTYCEEHIAGLDSRGNWDATPGDVWIHKCFNLSGGAPKLSPCDSGHVPDGWLEGTFATGLTEHPRLSYTGPLPRNVIISVGVPDGDDPKNAGMLPPPEVGSIWRLVFAVDGQEATQKIGIEIRGPASESDDCCSFQFVNITDSTIERPDREIPWYFLSEFAKGYTVTLCYDEAQGQIVASIDTYSEFHDPEADPPILPTPHTFSHRIVNIPSIGVPAFSCYRMWIELDKGAPGTYTFDNIVIGKSKSPPEDALQPGFCGCTPVTLLFSDPFDRANYTFALTPDPTGHWEKNGGTWQILSDEVKGHPDSLSIQSARLIANEHFTGTTPSGWQPPLAVTCGMKLPADGITGILGPLGYIVDIKANNGTVGANGTLRLIHWTNLNDPSTITVLDTATIPGLDPSVYHTLRWCYNGSVLRGIFTRADGRPFTVKSAVSITPGHYGFGMLIHSISSGNVDQDFFYDNFTVHSVQDPTEPPATTDSYSYSYDYDNGCSCCGPTDCQTSPPRAFDLFSCFWEDFGGSRRYKGSSTHIRSDCSRDDTIMVQFGGTAIDEATAMMKIEVYGQTLTYTAATSTLTLNGVSRTVTRSTGILLKLCVTDSIVVGVYNDVQLITLHTGGVSSEDRPVLTYSDITGMTATISYNIDDANCPDCFIQKTYPCPDETKSNCSGGVVPQAVGISVSIDLVDLGLPPDDPNMFCCQEFEDAFGGVVIARSTEDQIGFVNLSDTNGISQCVYGWSGFIRFHCDPPTTGDIDNTTFPKIVASVSLQKFAEGYRLCGSVSNAGDAPGAAASCVASGCSDVIAPADTPLDCLTGIVGDIPLTANSCLPTWECGVIPRSMSVFGV